MQIKPVAPRSEIRAILATVLEAPHDHSPTTTYWAQKLNEWYQKRQKGLIAFVESKEIRQIGRFYARLSWRERCEAQVVDKFIAKHGLSTTPEEFYAAWNAARVLRDRDGRLVHLYETQLYCCYRLETGSPDVYSSICRFINHDADVVADECDDLDERNRWLTWMRPADAAAVMAWRLAQFRLTQKVRDGLRFYADPISYLPTQMSEPRSAVHGDNGQRARQIMADLGLGGGS